MPTIPLTDRKIASLKPRARSPTSSIARFPARLRVNQGGRKTFILMYRTTDKKLRRLVLGVYGLQAPGIGLAKARELARKELDKGDHRTRSRGRTAASEAADVLSTHPSVPGATRKTREAELAR